MKLNIFSKKPKIKRENFIILKYNQYNLLHKYNYNTKQLKEILKFYKQKSSGNKNILIKRLYNFLLKSNAAIIIQKNIRKYWVQQFFVLSGPAFKNCKYCANETDFLSLTHLNEIDKMNFISFKDLDNFIYGFEFKSLYNLYIKSKKIPPKNPYNRKLLPSDVLKQIKKKIVLAKILNLHIDLILDEIDDGNIDLLRLRTMGIFQKIDELGNYTNINWFYNLNKYKIIKFIKELQEIWCYRAALTKNVQNKIIQKNFSFNTYKNDFHINKSYKHIKKKALNIIEQFVTMGIDKHHQSLGSFYVLGALTLVNKDAAAALPWLYESMIY